MPKKRAKAKTARKDTVLMLLVVLVLAVSLVNSLSIFTLTSKLDSAISGAVLMDAQEAGEGTGMPTETGDDITGAAAGAFVDGDYVKGDENAPVTIIEYSDFECPFCARFWEQTLPEIEENYIKTGKVKLIYRDFPLGFHANAQKAAEASECAGEQGKFWEYHDVLYDTRALSVSDLKQHAKDLGLDSTKFDSCLDSGKYAEEV
ncbi:MAG: DsbA family protein, partial [Candidatus Aenigmatarchaeota archaeon]